MLLREKESSVSLKRCESGSTTIEKFSDQKASTFPFLERRIEDVWLPPAFSILVKN